MDLSQLSTPTSSPGSFSNRVGNKIVDSELDQRLELIKIEDLVKTLENQQFIIEEPRKNATKNIIQEQADEIASLKIHLHTLQVQIAKPNGM